MADINYTDEKISRASDRIRYCKNGRSFDCKHKMFMAKDRRVKFCTKKCSTLCIPILHIVGSVDEEKLAFKDNPMGSSLTTIIKSAGCVRIAPNLLLYFIDFNAVSNLPFVLVQNTSCISFLSNIIIYEYSLC